jgi:Abnormal spindle-like microcephaly-assoc'd, ASPM-SPD-2-Hydin
MNRPGSARAELFPLEGNAFRLLLLAAMLTVALFQSGCAGITAAATNSSDLPAGFNPNTLTLSMGNVALGDSKTVPLSFTNSTNSAVTVQNVTVAGAGFSAMGVSNGTIVNPGQTATLNVTFTPARTGNASGNIVVTSNAPVSSVTITLQGVGVPAGNHLAILSWNASTSPVVGYFVYRSMSSGGPYTRLNASADTNTGYTDSSVVGGQSYYYVVTAVDSNGVEGSFSN